MPEVERHTKKKRKTVRPLSPQHSATVITKQGIRDFKAEEIQSVTVGWKAYGLSSLPSEWVPPFFIIAASCFKGDCCEKTINDWVIKCLAQIGIGKNQQVIVRSSGTAETMQDRGQLVSRICPSHSVVATIHELINQLPATIEGEVHWITQRYVPPKQKGHLSNERHLKKEPRDWIAEFEPQGHESGYTVSIAYRPWRDGTANVKPLRCDSSLQIESHLKDVAKWATSFSPRIHFEWVWDGKTVNIVQADIAESITGVKPSDLLPVNIQQIEPNSLQMFQAARPGDYDLYRKLHNAKLYESIGYFMPVFYMLDDSLAIANILSGQIPDKLADDLFELTKRLLIIRTDGKAIPNEKREMLPRSEELRSKEMAMRWLQDDFTSKIKDGNLEASNLCLIAHHFIPSVASAWARAEPGKRIVRIESLWGIPEGLYWYSHDTFEVDTINNEITTGQQQITANYKISEHLRYKGKFIAPNQNGEWVTYQTNPPHDWGKSIRDKKWLSEIAHGTRQVAEKEKYAVSVMWFVGNHPQATKHTVLPWFHSKSELFGDFKAAPRQKRSNARDFKIKSNDDWETLCQNLRSGAHIERVVVNPDDPKLIRNPTFAKELGCLAKSKNVVVELAGGILSHAYYMLQREGAKVEFIDLFGTNEEVMEYSKLVRDNIPSHIEQRGEQVKTVRLEGEALIRALREKLVEEAYEALDARSLQELIGEMADLQEVIIALCHVLGKDFATIETVRREKEKRRGGFTKGLMLIKTVTPHSIQNEIPSLTSFFDQETVQVSDVIISNVDDLPISSINLQPDLRQVNQEVEKYLSFKTEIFKIQDIVKSFGFSIPTDKNQQHDFTLKIELERENSGLRTIVRLRHHQRPTPVQLKFEFPDEN